MNELYNNKWVSIKEIDGWVYSHFTKSDSLTVGVLPYRIESEIMEFGVVHEDIPCHKDSTDIYLITGAVENSDLVGTAIMELAEEAGITAVESELIYLGKYYPLKHSDCQLHIFGVDVTNKEISTPTGDGSEHERGMKFDFVTEDILLRVSQDPNLLAGYSNLMRILRN